MTMGLLWALCDSIVSAIAAAQPTWQVEVALDAQRNLDALKTGEDVELLIGPIDAEEENSEGSRRGIAGSLTIAMRLRSRLGDSLDTQVAREKCSKWDMAVAILQRREGFDAGSFGKVYWTGGTAGIDLLALRNDRVVSVCSTDITFASLHFKPKAM